MRSWAGDRRNASLLVAIGVSADGCRKILETCTDTKEYRSRRSNLLKNLKGIQLTVSDACSGLIEWVDEFFLDIRWQRCVVHWYRNVFRHVSATKVHEVAAMLKAIHAAEDIKAATVKAERVKDGRRRMQKSQVSQLCAGIDERGGRFPVLAHRENAVLSPARCHRCENARGRPHHQPSVIIAVAINDDEKREASDVAVGRGYRLGRVYALSGGSWPLRCSSVIASLKKSSDQR